MLSAQAHDITGKKHRPLNFLRLQGLNAVPPQNQCLDRNQLAVPRENSALEIQTGTVVSDIYFWWQAWRFAFIDKNDDFTSKAKWVKLK